MRRSWLVVLGIGLVISGVALVGLRWRAGGGPQADARAKVAETAARRTRMAPRLPAPKLPARAAGQRAESAPPNSICRLFREGIPMLDRAQIDKFLARRQRDALSLLVDWLHTDDRSLLREAAGRFPGDPLVQLELGLCGESPEERRGALEACRLLAPDNPLPDYLLALDALEGGRTDEAVEALLRAWDKLVFADYSAELTAAVMDAYRSAGFAPLQAEVAGMFGAKHPHLSSLRELAKRMKDLQAGYREQGDPESAQAMGQIAVQMAAGLGNQPGHHLITDLVAMGIEQTMLESLPPEVLVTADGVTAGGRLKAIAERREELQSLGPVADRVLTLPESEVAIYLERVRLDGEAAALMWLRGRNGTAR